MDSCLNLVERSVGFLFAPNEAAASRVAEAVVRRVHAIDDGWFARTVARPIVGRLCDLLVRRAIVDVVLLFVASVVLSLAISAWLVPGFYLWINTHPGAPTAMGIVTMLVCEIAWMTPALMAYARILSVLDGLCQGFREWKLLYQQAQTADWARRHPGQSYWHGGWRFTRD